MNIFIEDKNRFFKYEVIIDREGLEELKYKIIDEYSIIEHIEKDDTFGFRDLSIYAYLRRRNYSEIKIGVREYNDFYSMPETLYHYSYDYYHFPYLIELIDEILEDKIDCLSDIYNINYDKELVPLDKRVEKLNNEINSLNNSDYKKIEKLNELKNLLEQIKLNKNQKNVYKAYELIRKHIKFRLVDSIDKSQVKNVVSFFQINYTLKVVSDKKVLQYIKKSSI